MDYLGQAEVVAELERNMRLDDRILKYLTVKLADQVDPATVEVEKPKPKKEAEKTEVAEEEAQSSEAQESEEEDTEEE
jgi:small subunit ribosomal protein S6